MAELPILNYPSLTYIFDILIAEIQFSCFFYKYTITFSNKFKNLQKYDSYLLKLYIEFLFVLDTKRSPNPSTSTPSFSVGGGGGHNNSSNLVLIFKDTQTLIGSDLPKFGIGFVVVIVAKD